MKRLFCFIALALLFQSVNAQLFTRKKLENLEELDQKKWSYGYFLSTNLYDFKFDYKDGSGDPDKDMQDIKVDRNIGFGLGMVGNLNLNQYLDLRFEPGVNFAIKRVLEFPEIDPEIISSGNEREVTSTYIHLPLLMKFSTKRINNFRPFVMGGLATSINLGSNQNNADDNYGGYFRMKTMTYYYELAFGIDLYFYYFKFTPSIRGVFALTNEMVRDNKDNRPSIYTGNIEGMYSRGVFLNLTFQ